MSDHLYRVWTSKGAIERTVATRKEADAERVIFARTLTWAEPGLSHTEALACVFIEEVKSQDAEYDSEALLLEATRVLQLIQPVAADPPECSVRCASGQLRHTNNYLTIPALVWVLAEALLRVNATELINALREEQ